MSIRSILKRLQGQPEPTELDTMHAALRVSTESLLDPSISSEEREEALAKTLDQFGTAFLSATPEDLSKGRRKQTMPPVDDAEDDEEDMMDDDEDLEDTEKSYTTYEEDDVNDEIITKRVEEATATLTKQLAEADTERVALAKRLASLEADIQQRERLAKADALVSSTGQKPEGVAAVLAKIEGDEVAIAAVNGLITALKAAQSEASLFKALGSDGQAPTDAQTRIEKRAEDIRKAEPSLTKQQAFAKAAREMPDDAYTPTQK
jgi:phosphoribosyl-ATP pyrophosphohydrolase